MSGGSKPSGQQVVTTSQNTGPWSGQQPYLTDSFQIARQLLDSDARNGSPGYFPGATYVNADWKTNEGTNNLFSRAQAGGTFNGVPAQQQIGAQASNLLSGGASGLPGYETLATTANGGMLGRNPEFQGMVTRAVEAARAPIDSQFAAAGRLGSGAHSNAMASAATNLAGNLAYQDYGRERQNQMSAASGLMGNDMAARNLGAQFGAQAGANDTQNIQAMLQSGAITEDYAQKALEDAINRYNWNQNLPWTQLQRYAGLIQGNYGQSGTGTQVAPVYGNAGLSTLFGGAGALGGLMQGAGALFAASDIRLKENVRRVGQLDNGLPVYSYNYKGHGTPQIGLMAQDVAQVKPHAVADIGGGLLGVNYAEASQ